MVDFTCKLCGKKFQSYKQTGGKDRIYCSKICSFSDRDRGKHISQAKNRGLLKSILCSVCKKEFQLFDCFIKEGRTCCSWKCRNLRRSDIMREKKNHLWKGGVTNNYYSIRSSKRYRDWRKEVLKRDDNKCVQCGITHAGMNIDHIVPFAWLLKKYNIQSREGSYGCPELWDINNGRTLCLSCHEKTDSYRKRY